MSTYICIACIICLLLLVLILCYKLYRFSLIILNVETSIEVSLEVLNERYEKMNEIAQKPVFFDSVEVRQVIAEIKACREAVLLIADKLTTGSGLATNEIKKEDSTETEKIIQK